MTIRTGRSALIAVLLTLGQVGLGAQVATYARQPGDTLRFRDEMKIEGSSRGRAGNQTMAINVRSRISMAFITADSAHAWYDSLDVGASSVNGAQQLPARSALNVPFVLRVGPTGAIQTLKAPQLPPLVRDIADYTPQFDDFFVRLPVAPFAPGAEWTDTIVHREGAPGGRQLMVQRIIHSKAAGDTTVGRDAAMRISTTTEIHIESTIPIQRQPFTARLVLDGTETGMAVVTRAGRLLSRERKGDIHGSTTYRGGTTDISVNQSFVFTGTLIAIAPPR